VGSLGAVPLAALLCCLLAPMRGCAKLNPPAVSPLCAGLRKTC
jgi:hypothetical protein